MFNYEKPKLHWKHLMMLQSIRLKWKVIPGFQIMVKRDFSFKVMSLQGPELKGDFNELNAYAS